jgi:hypothetical protein
MRAAGLRGTVALMALLSFAGPATSAANPLLGTWRSTNRCFLAAFLLTEDGRAQAVYLSGESDDDASWSWDGTMLKIVSRKFPLDGFDARPVEDRLEADYVWHERETDAYHREPCVFERLTPTGGNTGT